MTRSDGRLRLFQSVFKRRQKNGCAAEALLNHCMMKLREYIARKFL
jgi:hypothetical protein